MVRELNLHNMLENYIGGRNHMSEIFFMFEIMKTMGYIDLDTWEDFVDNAGNFSYDEKLDACVSPYGRIVKQFKKKEVE